MTLTSQIITSPGCWHQGAPAPSPAPAQSVQHPRNPLGFAEIHWGMRQLSLFFCPIFWLIRPSYQVHRYDSLKDILGNFQAHVGCSFIKVHRPGPALGCIYHSALQRVTAEEIWAAVAKATSGNSRRRPSTSERAETRAGVPATKVCIPQQRRKRRWSQWGLKKCSTFTTINNPDLCKETFNPTMITFCWRSWLANITMKFTGKSISMCHVPQLCSTTDLPASSPAPHVPNEMAPHHP